MLVNVNKLKSCQYMEFEMQKKEQHMLIYWEYNASGLQEANFDPKDDEGCEIQKPQMKNAKDKKQITNPTMNTIFISNLQMNNNYKSARFGMQRFKHDMLGMSAESTTIFAQSSRVFIQSSELWAQSTNKSVQSPNVFSQSTKGVQGE